MYADKILINGRIYTENNDMMWAEAVAAEYRSIPFYKLT